MLASIPLAALAFISIVLVIVTIDLARGAPLSAFLVKPGFIVSLALISFGASVLVRAAPMAAWARLVLAPLLAAVGLFGLVLVLNLFAR